MNFGFIIYINYCMKDFKNFINALNILFTFANLRYEKTSNNCARINIRYVSAIGAGRSTLCFIAWANM